MKMFKFNKKKNCLPLVNSEVPAPFKILKTLIGYHHTYSMTVNQDKA